MVDKIDEFVNDGGTLISSKIPNTDPKTTAKTTTDKSVRMRAQPFMYSVYRRFFSEGELPHTEKADELKDNPEGFHKFLESVGAGDQFESYFQKVEPQKALAEISKEKVYKMMETLFANRKSVEEVIPRMKPTIDEIENKESLLFSKLTRIADSMKLLLDEEEKEVLVKYFSDKLR